MHSRRIDLNLLTVLDVLLAERNVSRAAERLHLTQPAVSHALARAREALDDPLLIREGSKMVATPKGLRLQRRLSAVLADVDGLLHEVREFDPTRVHETVHIGITDYGDFVLMPAVMERLRRDARGVRVVTRNVSTEQLANDLSHGRLDMAVVFAHVSPADLHDEVLIEETYTCLASSAFPAPLTLARYLQAPHVQVSYAGALSGGPDEALAKLGLQREVVMSTPHFMAAAAAVARTGLLMTTPTRVARQLVADLPLTAFDPPFELPRIMLRLCWHTRVHADPVQAWLRGVLRDAAAQL